MKRLSFMLMLGILPFISGGCATTTPARVYTADTTLFHIEDVNPAEMKKLRQAINLLLLSDADKTLICSEIDARYDLFDDVYQYAAVTVEIKDGDLMLTMDTYNYDEGVDSDTGKKISSRYGSISNYKKLKDKWQGELSGNYD